MHLSKKSFYHCPVLSLSDFCLRLLCALFFPFSIQLSSLSVYFGFYRTISALFAFLSAFLSVRFPLRSFPFFNLRLSLLFSPKAGAFQNHSCLAICTKENDITPCSKITYLLLFDHGMAHKILQSKTRGRNSQFTRWIAVEIFEIDRPDVRVRGQFRNATYQIN